MHHHEWERQLSSEDGSAGRLSAHKLFAAQLLAARYALAAPEPLAAPGLRGCSGVDRLSVGFVDFPHNTPFVRV
ncbi:hypothetical protein [Nonomuraea rhizosphaerae]|uniref:hypothetical protein n=1 Tax=Nonomuraea rhizosphaerae TaxID=2665663 RepID=UPI001C5D57E2|nr:hypothetical protein [Nonomuraea rhizosphaerae]